MRIAAGLEYDGSGFCGWQTQPGRCGVQDAIESALSQIAGRRIATICAGRTDAGVHALAQVIHFDTEVERPASAWTRGVNALLPAAVAVTWAQPIAGDFHARFHAIERGYRYVLCNRRLRPALERYRVGWYHRPLDDEAMRAAARFLVGEHDFTAFRAAECQARTAIRDLRRIAIVRHSDYVVFEFSANAFLHHMVRNIVAGLVYVGAGKQSPHWVKDVLAGRDRQAAAPTFDAAGLYLSEVRYDPRWGLAPVSAGDFAGVLAAGRAGADRPNR